MKQAEYKGETYNIETVYVYDEYISFYQGNLLDTEAIKVPLSEVIVLPLHLVSKPLGYFYYWNDKYYINEINGDIIKGWRLLDNGAMIEV